MTNLRVRPIQSLAGTISLSQGRFKLIFARCNHKSLRTEVIQQVQDVSSVDIRTIELPNSASSLYNTIQQNIGENVPDAVMVCGLESVKNIDDMLRKANLMRDQFKIDFHFPLVLWITDEMQKKLIRIAPDFESWAIKMYFSLTQDQLIKLLQEICHDIFEKILEAGVGKFLSNTSVSLQLEPSSSRRSELESARSELEKNKVKLEPQLQASLEFVLGLVTEQSLEESKKHYLNSIELWESIPGEKSNFERLACVYHYMGRWWRSRAERQTNKEHYQSDCQEAKKHFELSNNYFKRSNNPKLATKFVNALGDVLQRLGYWTDLENNIRESYPIDENKTSEKIIEEIKYSDSNYKFRLARAYGFLAQVALNLPKDEVKTEEYAQKALAIFEKTFKDCSDDVSEEQKDWEEHFHKGWYLFSLAQAEIEQKRKATTEEIKQEKNEKARENLELALEITYSNYDPKLVIEILDTLYDLYKEQDERIKAFKLKQQKQEIEWRYGSQVFIGVVPLESEEQPKNPVFQNPEEKIKIAKEIIASGREQEVDRLFEEICRPDKKLTIVYGKPGVGKTSLLQAGLVPKLLQKKTIDGYKILPILQKENYQEWIKTFDQCLQTSLKKYKVISQSKKYDYQNKENKTLECKVIEQLRKNVDSNIMTVIIFDEFEEFFWTHTTLDERKHFYKFLQECLDIPFVKVILSLREDYLPYLLECNYLNNFFEVINNNILDKNILFPLNNLSLDQTRSLIKKLSQELREKDPKSIIMNELHIDELVNTLADQSEQVSPIELQIMGKMLLRLLGNNKEQELNKNQLVKQYLDEIIDDCGAENKTTAKQVLYLLTDISENKLIRPLRTKSELREQLTFREAAKLDIVLEILCLSGLVVKVDAPDLNLVNYHLISDYLLNLIREHCKTKEYEPRKAAMKAAILRTEADLLSRQASSIRDKDQDKSPAVPMEIEALSLWGKAYWDLHNQLEALQYSLKGGHKLKESEKLGISVPPESRSLCIQTLGNILYRIQEWNRLEGHNKGKGINSICFSPDGQMIASGSSDRKVKLWNLDSEEQNNFNFDHDTEVNSICFSHDGQMIASADSEGIIKLWNIMGIPNNYQNDLLITKFEAHSDSINDISFSSNSQLLASASADGLVKIGKLNNGQDIENKYTFQDHRQPINSLCFTADDQKIISAGADGKVKMWNLQDPEKPEIDFMNKETQGEFNSVCLSFDLNKVVASHVDGTLKVWDLNNPNSPPETLPSFSTTTNPVNQVCCHKGKIASGHFDGTISIWNLETKRKIQSFIAYPGQEEIKSLCFSPDGEILASGSKDCASVKLWKLSHKELRVLKKDDSYINGVNNVCFSADSQRIAAVSADNTIKVWNLDGELLRTFTGHSKPINDICFVSTNDQDDYKIVSGSGDHTVKLWSLDSDEPQTFIGERLSKKSHDTWIRNVCSSPNGKIVSASARGILKLWNLDGKELGEFPADPQKRQIRQLSFSPNSEIIVSVGIDDGKATLWNLQGKEQGTLEHKDIITNICFSSDSQMIASGSRDGIIKLWKFEGNQWHSWKEPLKGHRSAVCGLHFHSDDKTLTSLDAKGMLINWDLEQGKKQLAIPQDRVWGTCIGLSPDTQWILSTNSEGTLTLWKSDLTFDLDTLLQKGDEWIEKYL